MANIKKKLYHEELAERIECKEDVELLPEYDINEGKKEEVILVKDKDRADRCVEFPASRHIDKCKLRACIEFDVTLQHLSAVVRDLNGRKIDGVYINDIIGRFGFYNGVQLNRSQLAAKYNRSVQELEFVHDKVKAIIQHKDFMKAYDKYIEGVKKETEKEITDKQKFGE